MLVLVLAGPLVTPNALIVCLSVWWTLATTHSKLGVCHSVCWTFSNDTLTAMCVIVPAEPLLHLPHSPSPSDLKLTTLKNQDTVRIMPSTNNFLFSAICNKEIKKKQTNIVLGHSGDRTNPAYRKDHDSPSVHMHECTCLCMYVYTWRRYICTCVINANWPHPLIWTWDRCHE